MDDPALQNKGVFSDSSENDIKPYTFGLYALNIADEQVSKLGEFVNDLYTQVGLKHKRQITRNAYTMLQGAVFAIGTNALGNLEWKEHCSSSLREIFHEWGAPDALKGDLALIVKKGTKLNADESQNVKEFWILYQYFSGIDHHEVSAVLNSLRAYTSDQSLKPDHCYTDEIFILSVKNFFNHLLKISEIK